jgi:hypothetical protein
VMIRRRRLTRRMTGAMRRRMTRVMTSYEGLCLMMLLKTEVSSLVVLRS